MSETKAERFLRALSELVEQEDRGALAVLKRSLAFKPGTYVPAFRYVEPFVRSEDGWPREVYYLTAGLFALWPTEGSQTLSEALARVFRRRQSASIEARFLALLDADRDQLPDRLRRAVSLVRAERVGLDWSRLLSDLVDWFRPDRRVQREWARAFYRAAAEEDAGLEEEVASA